VKEIITNLRFGSAELHVRPDEMLHFSLNGSVDNVDPLLAFTVTSFEPCRLHQLAAHGADGGLPTVCDGKDTEDAREC